MHPVPCSSEAEGDQTERVISERVPASEGGAHGDTCSGARKGSGNMTNMLPFLNALKCWLLWKSWPLGSNSIGAFCYDGTDRV